MPSPRAPRARPAPIDPAVASYFRSVADARYVLRRAFRIVEEHARSHGLEPVPHQALIQLLGSERGSLRVSELAERLDVTPAFASMLVRDLAARRLVARGTDSTDRRTTPVSITPAGASLVATIDAEVWPLVDAFTAALPAAGRRVARSVLMFYVGRRRSKVVRGERTAAARLAYTGATDSLAKRDMTCALDPSPSSSSPQPRRPRSRKRPSSRSVRRSPSTG